MRAIALAAAFALAPLSAAHAWGPIGHRVIGAIGESYLTPKAKAAVVAILGNESLAEASTWADEMRPSPDPFWKTEAGAYHYVTVPPGKTYAEVGAPPEGDAVTALAKFAAILKDPKASLADKQRALRFTVHIVGDLQMPLHAGNGKDRGGNDVKVTAFGEATNLHWLWDELLITRRELSYTEMTAFLARKITPDDVKAWGSVDPKVWIAESAALRDTIYPEGDQVGYDYEFKFRDTVDKRLMQGGVRIGAYLNAVFG